MRLGLNLTVPMDGTGGLESVLTGKLRHILALRLDLKEARCEGFIDGCCTRFPRGMLKMEAERGRWPFCVGILLLCRVNLDLAVMYLGKSFDVWSVR